MSSKEGGDDFSHLAISRWELYSAKKHFRAVKLARLLKRGDHNEDICTLTLHWVEQSTTVSNRNRESSRIRESLGSWQRQQPGLTCAIYFYRRKHSSQWTRYKLISDPWVPKRDGKEDPDTRFLQGFRALKPDLERVHASTFRFRASEL